MDTKQPKDSCVPFCTCKDHDCPFNPVNHDQGCTPCIAKNLREGEIPSCFFVAVSGRADQGRYHYLDFAETVFSSRAKPCGNSCDYTIDKAVR